MGEFGPWHIVIVLLVFALLFGGKRLPDAARGLGQSLRIFRREMNGAPEQPAPPAPPAESAVPAQAPAIPPQSVTEPAPAPTVAQSAARPVEPA